MPILAKERVLTTMGFHVLLKLPSVSAAVTINLLFSIINYSRNYFLHLQEEVYLFFDILGAYFKDCV